MKKDGNTITIADRVGFGFITDGKVLYYVKYENSEYPDKTTIYKYTISSGKRQRLKSGGEYEVCGCSGKYLYYTERDQLDWRLYSLNLKTKKEKVYD